MPYTNQTQPPEDTQRPAALKPVSRPFVIYSGNNISGTAAGSPGMGNYCSLACTAESRYRLNRCDHNKIFPFTLTSEGSVCPTYCLDKYKNGPFNHIPYKSASLDLILPSATEKQKQMLAWILANAYPSISAADTFALAEADYTSYPSLDSNDAYAAVQAAIWVLLGQLTINEAEFIKCSSNTPHPKSHRLHKTVLKLISLAAAYADSMSDRRQPDSCHNSFSAYCGQYSVHCCGRTMPSGLGVPYLTFKGCPDEICTDCGRLIAGPFYIKSNLTGELTVSVNPLCACDNGFEADFVDSCRNPICSPKIGREFYIAVKMTDHFFCFNINASISGCITQVAALCPDCTASQYQPVTLTLENVKVTKCASICVCIVNNGFSCSDTGYKGNPDFYPPIMCAPVMPYLWTLTPGIMLPPYPAQPLACPQPPCPYRPNFPDRRQVKPSSGPHSYYESAGR